MTQELLTAVERALPRVGCALNASTIDSSTYHIVDGDRAEIGRIRLRHGRITFIAVGTTVVFAHPRSGADSQLIARLSEAIERSRRRAD